MKKALRHNLNHMQRKNRSKRKKWTAIEKFEIVQNNLVRNAIAQDKKPPRRLVKRKLNPTQLFERRQQRLKSIRPTITEEPVVIETTEEHVHSENCQHEE